MSDARVGHTLSLMINHDINEAAERGLTSRELFNILGSRVEIMLDGIEERYRQKVWDEFKRIIEKHTGLT